MVDKNPHIYLRGRRKVLITAPHAEEHKRKGQFKQAERTTGQIATFLSEQYNCHALLTNGRQDHDPSFDAYCPLTLNTCPFKDKIDAIIKQHGIRLVIDLHLLRQDRPFLFVIGTNDELTTLGYAFLTPLLKSKLAHIAAEDLCLVNPEFGYSARHKAAIARYVSGKHFVPSIQLEINTSLCQEWQEVSLQLADFVRQTVPLNRKSLI